MWQQVKHVYFFIGSIVSLLILVKGFSYFIPNFNAGFLSDKQDIFSFYQYGLYAHVIFSPLSILLGYLQFLDIKNRFHQQIGKAYVFSILIFAAPSGLFMAFYALGGIWGKVNFILLSLLWFVYTLLAFYSIKNGKVKQHKQWIIGSFILTNSAVLLRIFAFINTKLHITEGANSYVIVSMLSWLPTILFYEIYSRVNISKRT